jgi:hypothetical protein
MAVSAIANIVKSSLGPVGLDKMLVDDVGVSIFLPKLHVDEFDCKKHVQMLLIWSFCTLVLLLIKLCFFDMGRAGMFVKFEIFTLESNHKKNHLLGCHSDKRWCHYIEVT